jgi:hypothetical protein
MKNYGMLFILGAADPEMERIEAVLRAQGERVAYAMKDGRRVAPFNSYQADAVTVSEVDESLCFVECRPAGDYAVPVTVIDHHNPGDPGFGKEPGAFFEASSIGQVLTLLGLEPTEDQLYAAAADHCLSAAYKGLCQGIDPDKLYRWRLEGRAAFQKRPVSELLEDGRKALRMIEGAPSVELGRSGVFVRDLRGATVPELPDAQARLGLSVLCQGLPGKDGRIKLNLMGSEEACAAFLAFCPGWLVDSYGDPKRGIVGAYVPS